MRFAFTDDQLAFRDAVRTLLDKECPPTFVREWWEQPDWARGGTSDVWASLVEMGVVGMTVPEAQGGLGMDMLDLVLLLEEAGRAALPEPLLETTGVAAPLLAALGGPPADLWLPGIATGERVFTVASRPDALISTVNVDGVLVLAGDAIHLVEFPMPDDGSFVAEASVDGSRKLFRMVAPLDDGTLIARDAATAVADATARATLGTAAQLLGLADRMIELTTEYVKERKQFGVPIGSFQAVKHHLADALLAVEFARPAVYNAAYSLAHGLDTAPRDVSMAKCLASDAAHVSGRKALQCHGAIGYTVEYDLHLYLKRSWALSRSWGDAAHHRRQVARAILRSEEQPDA